MTSMKCDSSHPQPIINKLSYIDGENPLPNGGTQYKLQQASFFTDEQNNAIVKAVSVLDLYFENLFRLDGVRAAYHEFEDEIVKLDVTHGGNKATIDRRFRAYVLEWKLFLDHWHRFIKDGAQTIYRVGKNEKEEKQYLELFERLYNDTTRETYDKCEDYVLATVIRNHVSHAFDSVDRVSIDMKKVYVKTEKIIEGHHVSASQRSILEKQKNYIDLEKVADGSLAAVEHVNEELLNFMIDAEVVNASNTLLEAYVTIQNAKLETKKWLLCDYCKVESVQEQEIVLTRIKDENGKKIVPEQHRMQLSIPEIGIHFRGLNWDAYIAFASYTNTLWRKGYWKELQSKYSIKTE